MHEDLTVKIQSPPVWWAPNLGNSGQSSEGKQVILYPFSGKEIKERSVDITLHNISV